MSRRVLRTFKLREISAVDEPAQEHARVMLMKGANTMSSNLDKCIKASNIAPSDIYKTVDPITGLTNRDFEEALDEYVEKKRHDAESFTDAYDRLLKEDDTASRLAFASFNAAKVSPVAR